MNNPKISVVTVCYNTVNTIEKTILSVLNQTYQNIEFIIIDGCSSDGTIDVINKFQDKISYFLSEPDKGIYDAMNKAIRVATGDFLIFLGADDVLHKSNTFEKIQNYFLDKDVVYYGNVIFNGSGFVYWGKFNKWKWGVGNISHQALFYPKSVYSNYDYDLKYKIYADYAYNLLLLLRGHRFLYVPIVVTNYAMDGVSAKQKDEFFEADRLKLIREAVGYFPMLFGVIYRSIQLFKRRMCRFLYGELK